MPTEPDPTPRTRRNGRGDHAARLDAATFAAIDRTIAGYRGPLDHWPDEDGGNPLPSPALQPGDASFTLNPPGRRE